MNINRTLTYAAGAGAAAGGARFHQKPRGKQIGPRGNGAIGPGPHKRRHCLPRPEQKREAGHL